MRYGFICYDQWPEIKEEWATVPAVVGDDGEILEPEVQELVQPYQAAGDRYSFRMDELALFIARGFDARLSALEGKE